MARKEEEIQAALKPHIERIKEWHARFHGHLSERQFYRGKITELLTPMDKALEAAISCNPEEVLKSLVRYGEAREEMLGSFPDEDPVQEDFRITSDEFTVEMISRIAQEMHDHCNCLDYTHQLRM